MKLRRIISLTLTFLMLITAIPAFDIQALAAYSMPYYIEVDITNQIVTIYKTKDSSIARQMLCSSGISDYTNTGTFYLPKKQRDSERSEWYYFYEFECWAKYATRIYGSVLFHSIPYSEKRESSISKAAVKDFGKQASHGCVRLRWQDAKFIAENCAAGTAVKIYRSKKKNEGLRELLKQASYVGQEGMTYEQYMGMPENEGDLGRFSTGREVSDLQHRLKALGLFNDEPDGNYFSSTVNAVKQFQALKGLQQTGITSLELQEAIYAPDAPTAMNVTIEMGANGPVVRQLQENLRTLKLYEGAIDGVYDQDVIEAVHTFQQAYTYSTDDSVTDEVQKAIHYEAGKIKSLYALEEDYTLDVTEDVMYMGKISSQTGIRIREKASVESEALGRLTDGDYVIVLKRGENWSQIQFGKCIGYIKNVFADYFKQPIRVLTYTSSDGDRVYSIGYTVEDYRSGNDRPAEIFEEYLAMDGSLEDYEGLVEYATVDTEEGVVLNLRSNPNTSSDVLAELESGTHAKVILRSSEWTLVKVNGQDGYLMNDYLEFWSGPEDALDPVEEAVEEVEELPEEIFAVTSPAEATKAPVYDMDSDDAKVLGHLAKGIEVKVVKSTNGWCLIEYEGHQGYMKDADLNFNSEYAFEQA